MNVSEKIAVILEFNGYTQDELQDYLTLKFVPMTKGGMTASFLSQTGYKRAKAVILDRPQLNENQQLVLEYLKYRFGKYDDVFVRNIFGPIDDLISECLDDDINDAGGALSLKEEAQVLQAFSAWVLSEESL